LRGLLRARRNGQRESDQERARDKHKARQDHEQAHPKYAGGTGGWQKRTNHAPSPQRRIWIHGPRVLGAGLMQAVVFIFYHVWPSRLTSSRGGTIYGRLYQEAGGSASRFLTCKVAADQGCAARE
jgi:hypothetical protein